MSEHDEHWGEEDLDDSVEMEVLQDKDEDVILVTDDGTAINLSQPLLNPEEARELTTNIKSTADMLYVLIARAHAGKAWDALGYSSFESYVREEFDMSRSRAYQLLNQNSIVEAITAAAPEGTEFHITEAAARDIKNILSDVLPEVSLRTDGLSPEEAGNVIEDLVRLEREKKAAGLGFSEDDLLDDDSEGFSASSMGNGLGNGNYDGARFGEVDEGALDDLDLDDMDDLLTFEEDPQEVRRNYDAVYVLYTVLNMMKDSPPVDGVIAMIPVERRVQVESSLAGPVAWLNEFSEKWNAQPWRESQDDESDDGTDVDDEDADEPLGEFQVDNEVNSMFDDLEK